MKDRSVEYISDLTNLEYLDFEGCPDITDTGVRHLIKLVNLEHLNFEGCSEITHVGLSYIQDLTKLKYLNIQGFIIIWCSLKVVSISMTKGSYI